MQEQLLKGPGPGGRGWVGGGSCVRSHVCVRVRVLVGTAAVWCAARAAAWACCSPLLSARCNAPAQVCGGVVLRCLTEKQDEIKNDACRKEVFYFMKMEVQVRAQRG